MFVVSNIRAGLQCSAVVLAIVGLSPVPLVLPSGIAVAVIGLMGAALLLTPVAVVCHSERSRRVGVPRERHRVAVGPGRLRDRSGGWV
jgi:hypothetical protein